MRNDRHRGASSVPTGWTAPRPRGAVLVLAAVIMAVLFGMTAFTVDISFIAHTKAQLQHAVDAAALAGAQALPDGSEPAREAAREVGGSNEAAGSPLQVLDADVELGMWDETTYSFIPLSGSAESAANAVRVTGRLTKARNRQLHLFFAPVIGVNDSDVQATATALLEISPCGRVVGLESVELENGEVDSFDSAHGPCGGDNRGTAGHVCSNGPILLDSNSSIRGSALPGPGYTVNRPDRVTGSTQPRRRELVAPPVDTSTVQLSNDNRFLEVAGLGNDDGNGGGSISLSGTRRVDLPPGIYFIDGDLSISGKASLHISGPAEIYVTGTIDITGRGLVNSGRPGDLRIHSTGHRVRIAGTAAFQGVVYAPQAAVEVQGAFCGAVLGRTLKLRGKAAVHYDESLDPILPEFARPVLVH